MYFKFPRNHIEKSEMKEVTLILFWIIFNLTQYIQKYLAGNQCKNYWGVPEWLRWLRGTPSSDQHTRGARNGSPRRKCSVLDLSYWGASGTPECKCSLGVKGTGVQQDRTHPAALMSYGTHLDSRSNWGMGRTYWPTWWVMIWAEEGKGGWKWKGEGMWVLFSLF